MVTVPTAADDVTAGQADFADIPLMSDRVNPFTQVPDWVAYSRISVQAKFLYWVLASHINMSRGDRKVWPSRATLAAFLDRSPRAVDGYLAELESLRAISKYERFGTDGGQDSNGYVVYDLPPEGYAGPISVREAHLRMKAGTFTAKPPAKGEEAPPSQPTATPPSQSTATPPSQPTAAPPSSPLRTNKTKKNNTKRNKTKNPPPTPRDESAAGATAGPQRGEGGNSNKTNPEAEALVADLAVEWGMGENDVTRAIPAVVAAMDRGWTVEQIRAHVTKRGAGGLEDTGAGMAARLKNLPPTPAPVKPSLGPRCTDPRHDELNPLDRKLYDDDGLFVGYCPDPDCLSPTTNGDSR